MEKEILKEKFKLSDLLLEKMILFLTNKGNNYNEAINIIDEFENSRLPKNYPNQNIGYIAKLETVRIYLF